MPDEPRRRMSRHIRLVLITGLPGLFGCGGCGGTTAPPPAPEAMEEVEEFDEDPPPDGPGHMVGAPFIAWWAATHPPIVTRRLVPRATVLGGGYTRTASGYYRHPFYGGRSSYLYGSSGVRSSSRPAGSSGVVRGGFGSTGHAAAGG